MYVGGSGALKNSGLTQYFGKHENLGFFYYSDLEKESFYNSESLLV